ncbi:MAG: DUF1232 domain-containing protein [Desulfobacteraceae bacterium]|nr:DUF1232 domain-containing protein [Desulfobacteraceae bacterium]
MFERLKSVPNSLKQEIKYYRLVLKDNRTPRIAKIILGIAIGYIFLPFDLIPDWIPVIGHLDDLIVVPILVIIGLKFIPEEVKRECRKKSQE